jgi:hypothetical protein
VLDGWASKIQDATIGEVFAVILEVVGFLALYIVLYAVLARFNKGIWVLPIYVLIVTIWYRPVIDHFTMLILIFVFVTAALAEGAKQRSTEKLADVLSKKEAKSKLEEISESLIELREKVRCLDFVPYSVSIRIDCGASKLWALSQSLGFCDGKEWINGVKLGEAKQGYELRRGISFQVLSSDQYGDPHLVYRTDGKTPYFQTGIDELRRTIEEFTFEKVRDKALPEEFRIAFEAISGPKHPVLCFGRLVRDSKDTYQIAIEVDEDWWKEISNKPEVECQMVRKGDEHGPHVSVYLVLARIPKRAIHGDTPESSTQELLDQYEAQLEALGWKFVDRGHLEHKFVSISRHDLDGRSSVTGWWNT